MYADLLLWGRPCVKWREIIYTFINVEKTNAHSTKGNNMCANFVINRLRTHHLYLHINVSKQQNQQMHANWLSGIYC